MSLNITNEDNMLLMARYPDNYFDLAIVDPPYGINIEQRVFKDNKKWDSETPTKEYQVAMLKCLEDAPKHVFFICATTDPQNLLPTFRNRCTTFEVSKLTQKQMEFLILSVLESENVEDVPMEVGEHTPAASRPERSKAVQVPRGTRLY